MDLSISIYTTNMQVPTMNAAQVGHVSGENALFHSLVDRGVGWSC
jgi:hypothetical protein